MPRKLKFKKGQRVQRDHRRGTLVRGVGGHPEWLVKLDEGGFTFWWESDMRPADAD